MQRLIEYTGGSIFFTFGILFFSAMAVLVTLINFFKLLKQQDMKRARKIELVVTVICVIIIAAFAGGLAGYCIGILNALGK